MSILNVRVVKTHFGYQVECAVRGCPDSPCDSLTHKAVFRDRARAENFLSRVVRKPTSQWNYNCWNLPGSHNGIYSVI